MVKLYPFERYHSVYTRFKVREFMARIFAVRVCSGQVE